MFTAPAVEMMMNIFYMSLFALLTLQSTFTNLCSPISTWLNIFSPVCPLGSTIPLELNLLFFVPFPPFDRQFLYNRRNSVGMPFFAALLRNHWLLANKHTTLPFNLAAVGSAGQYASYTGAGKSVTSLGCIGMRRYMNPVLTMLTGVQPTFLV